MADLAWRRFGLPKRGHRPDEYEDAIDGDPAAGRFAIADGVTESSFAAEWARLLVARYRETPPRFDAWADWLAAPQRLWDASVGTAELPWYAEEKRDAGAAATFLGVEVTAEPAGRRWSAVAVGDCCLFHVRGGTLARAFPIVHPEAFDTVPAVLLSRPPAGGSEEPSAAWAGGELRPGDRLVLMSDALAQWFLRRSAAGKPLAPVVDRWLEVSATDAVFSDWVAELRASGQLRNDDVTLGVIAVG
jgi:hypothetical protein